MNWLTKWFRGKTQARRQPIRKAQGCRLSLEALEGRQLLSASTSLIAGNGNLITLDSNHVLWETIANTAQRVQIDSNVQSVAVAGNGHVIDLENSGDLYEHVSPALTSGYRGQWVPLDAHVQSFFVTGNGDLVASENSGRFYVHITSASTSDGASASA